MWTAGASTNGNDQLVVKSTGDGHLNFTDDLRIIVGMNIEKINAAVQPLLDSCLASEDPAACLHQELDRLRVNDGWQDAELKHLQLMALHALKEIVQQ